MDPRYRFTTFSSECPVGMSDSITFLRWKLSKLSEEVGECILVEEGAKGLSN